MWAIWKIIFLNQVSVALVFLNGRKGISRVTVLIQSTHLQWQTCRLQHTPNTHNSVPLYLPSVLLLRCVSSGVSEKPQQYPRLCSDVFEEKCLKQSFYLNKNYLKMPWSLMTVFKSHRNTLYPASTVATRQKSLATPLQITGNHHKHPSNTFKYPEDHRNHLFMPPTTP